MYLIRPVNGADSVLASTNGKGLGKKNADDTSVVTGHSHHSDDSTINTLEKLKKKKENERDLRVQVNLIPKSLIIYDRIQFDQN